MAEYKYRALGWKDDDIASLNVVDGTAADGTAADNQVVLQITKQGAGGTIDGPAIVGKDGITIGKAADSEKIEISGSGLVKHANLKGFLRAYVVDPNANDGTIILRSGGDNAGNTVMLRKADGSCEIAMPETPVNLSITNKKYVDDNYVKKDTSVAALQVYGHDAKGEPKMFNVSTANANPERLCVYQPAALGAKKPTDTGRLITQDPTQPYQAANKHYVDEADKNLSLKLSNLEQALNGYILDTTKEAYADLDSAVLKNSVAVGDNVYPIADKTRALVTRIEGKTMKMVQLANTETLDNEQIKNGITLIKNADGSLTANGTATAKTWGLYAISRSLFYPVAGSKYLLLGSPDGYGRNTYYLNDASGRISEGEIKTLDGSAISIRIVFVEGFVAENITFKPQFFNLTAIYGEGNEPTTVEQFKADFPNAFYPYAEGNIYPAKISGVKFTGKNLFNINQFERYNPNDTSDVRVLNDKLLITGYTINLPNNHYFSNLIRSLKPNTQYAISVNISNYISNSSGEIIFVRKNNDIIKKFLFTRNGYSSDVFSLTQEDIDTFDYVRIYGNLETQPPIIMTNLQIEENSAPTAYEPYTEPVSVTLPETYDLHGIGDYKDYLEITKNEDNELYTLKKVQNVGVYEYTGNEAWAVGDDNLTSVFRYYCTDIVIPKTLGDKGICNKYATLTDSKDEEGVLFGLSNAFIYLFLNKTNFPDINSVKSYLSAQYAENNPVVIYYRLSSPVETVIATNLTYEQVTAIRHNGGLIEVEGNTNKGYAKPTVTNTIVYRLTATNKAEG